VYDFIARTASIILVALMLVGVLMYWLPVPRFPKRFWRWNPLRRILFILGIVFFLILVIEWASEHQWVH